jgi:hypothetical protein
MPKNRSTISAFAASRRMTSPTPTSPSCSTNSKQARPASACIARSTTAASYGYLAAGWDDQLRMESTERVYSNGLMIVDMSDPAKVKEVSRWWVPGQRLDEEELYRATYPFAGDQCSWTGNRTPCIVPVRVEDGGTVGYGGWGHFGMYVHDLTDIRNPKILAR